MESFGQFDGQLSQETLSCVELGLFTRRASSFGGGSGSLGGMKKSVV